jgi:hypothetical protein
MQSIGMAVPVQPGKLERLRELARELREERSVEFRGFLERLQTSEEKWFLQEIEGRPHCILYLAAHDVARAFEALARSNHPFDEWIKKENAEIFGIDFSRPSSAPPPELLFDFALQA